MPHLAHVRVADDRSAGGRDLPPRPVDPRGSRLAAASGAAFGALQLAMAVVFGAVILPRIGAPTAAPADRLAAYVAHGDLLRLGNYLLTLPTPLFLLFLGALHGAVRRASGPVLAAAAALAGAAVAMLWPLSAVLNDLAVDIARNGGDAGTVAALDAIGPYLLALGALGRVVLLGVASVELPRAGLAPRWTGWLGAAAAVASGAGTLTLVDGRAFGVLALGTLAFDGWLVAVGIALWRDVPAARPRGEPWGGGALLNSVR